MHVDKHHVLRNILTNILLCIWKIPRTDTITIFVGLIRTSFVSKRHWFFSTCQIKMHLKFQTCQRRVARMEEGRWTRRRSWASSTRSSELSGAHQNPSTEYFQSKNLLSWNLCDRPTEDFDPEQEDWEKAVKVKFCFPLPSL